MAQQNVQPQTNYQNSTDWLRRRARVPAATASALAELAFETRARRLGDSGTCLEAIWLEARR